jgi:predicted ferric reductase
VKSQLWWYVARSGGIVAWLLLAVSFVVGLVLATRILGRLPTPAWLTDVHRFLGGLALVFTGVHLVGLVADSYTHFGLASLLVPFASSWKPVATAWGVVALYLLLAVELTSLAMRHIPRRLWRGVHFSSFALFLVASVHGATAGTDATNIAYRWSAVLLVALATILTLVRVAVGRRHVARRVPAVRSASSNTTSETVSV